MNKRRDFLMKRREFITLCGRAAAMWPVAAKAQLREKPIVGFLGSTTPSSAARWVAAFQQRLYELGWKESDNVTIEYRWGEGRGDLFAKYAAEFVQLKVAVIVTAGGAVPAAKIATSVIPIVFAVASDPVGGGLVASLARPGGNVTGLSLQLGDTASKRLEGLREILPGMRRLAVMANVGYPASVLEMQEVQSVGHPLGIEIDRWEVRRVDDIATAFKAAKNALNGVYIAADPLLTTNRALIAALALDARLPTVTGAREYAEGGALLSYGASYSDLYRRAADLVDKILRGAKPSDIPVEQPTRFELVINLKTAKALGLTVPDKLLALADEVLE